MTQNSDRFTVAVVTALPIESAAVRAVLNMRESLPGRDDDPNYYMAGSAPSLDPRCPHEVVTALLPFDGTRSAAVVVGDLLRSFPAVRVVLVVGIAAGVPRPDDPRYDVRLGDVVVGTKIVAVDQIRLVDGVESLRHQPGDVSIDLLRAARELQAADDRPWEALLTPPSPSFARPGGAAPLKVHFGPIASGDQLMRDARRRDEIAARHEVMAFEMEASGVAIAAGLKGRQSMTVRGVSDFGDWAKNEVWQPYAALGAAAVTRALLQRCRPLADDRARPAGRHSPPPGSAVPPRSTVIAIADLLMALPITADTQTRQLVIAQLPSSIRGALRPNLPSRLELIDLVQVLFRYEDGPRHLLDVIVDLDGVSMAAHHLMVALEGPDDPAALSQ